METKLYVETEIKPLEVKPSEIKTPDIRSQEIKPPEIKPPGMKPDPEAAIAFSATQQMRELLAPKSMDEVVLAEEWETVGAIRDDMLSKYQAAGQNPMTTTNEARQNAYPKMRWRLIWVAALLLWYELMSESPRRMACVAKFFLLKSVHLTMAIPSSVPMPSSIHVKPNKRQVILSQRRKLSR